MEAVSFRVDKGDKIGLVGRNGAGKTTLTKVLAGEGLPAAGTVTRNGEIGYLPQDPRTPDMEQLARDRILSARGLDVACAQAARGAEEMASEDADVAAKAMRRYDRLEAEFLAARRLCGRGRGRRDLLNLALPDRILNQPLQDPLRRPAAPRGAGPDPVLRRRNHAPGRAHQPPRRRLDHLAARLPARTTRAG